MLKRFFQEGVLEAGCDEAGRGCLAGPVTAAAVILPEGFSSSKLDDSKKLSRKVRDELRIQIEEQALAWSVSMIFPEEIDKLNILWASIEGMHRSLDSLSHPPEHILVDGNKFKPYKEVPYKTVVKGDSKYLSIAAASVLAKTHRDEFMAKLHEDFPYYNWIKNKGYPTAEHREAIQSEGPCIHHRKSFRLLPQQLELF
jgi:ribonuclease HII